MRVERHASLVAWSDDGQGALIRLETFSPEGGKALEYRLLCPVKEVDLHWKISDTRSHGGAKRPQSISEAGYTATVEAMRQALLENGVSSALVRLLPDDRSETVQPAVFLDGDLDPREDTVYASLADAEAAAQPAGDAIQLKSPRQAPPKGPVVESLLSPTGRLALLFTRQAAPGTTRTLDQVLYWQDGAIRRWP